MIFFFIAILIIYFLTISLLIFGFGKVKTIIPNYLEPKTSFAIVVPFRNEESNVLELLNSVAGLDYPKNLYEIVVINDDSTDNSVSIFEKWVLENPAIQSRLCQNIRKSNSPKKDAIATAVIKIQDNWIITTDADCVVNKNWLLAFDNLIQNSIFEMIAAPVSILNKKGFLNYFQFIDLLSLQGTTIGTFGLKKPFMCNGANFAYTKKLFLELNGFEGNDKIASGDDVFLLQKALKFYPNKVAYLKNKDAIVFTKPEKNWSKLFTQRVRWASKTDSYDGFFEKFLAVIVLLTNLAIIIGIFILNNKFLIGIFLIKFVIDLILLIKTNRFISDQKFLFPIISGLFYPFFCVSVAFYSFFGGFEWKNRKFKQ